jgi:hypothetical protein
VHKRPVRFLACLLVILVLAPPLAAQSGILQGTVSDSLGATLPNASVSVEGTGLRGTTSRWPNPPSSSRRSMW